MTKEQKIAALSPKARKLYERVCDSANWYAGTGHVALEARTPAAMQELLDAGLVVVGGRVERLVSCYVPKGTKPFKLEKFPS